MKIPGFTAEDSLRTTSRPYRATRTNRGITAIQPALTARACYQRDSNCTHFCGGANADWRYECFSRCDIYLNNCLDRGEWTDRP
jgi:hypothetical protein